MFRFDESKVVERDIVLRATFGDVEKKLTLSFVHGAAGVVHIYIDRSYHGQCVKIRGEWAVYINAKSELCSNDILIIQEILNNQTKDV